MKPAGQSTRKMQERHYQRRMLIALAILVVGVLFFLTLKLVGYFHSLATIVGFTFGLLLVLKIALSSLEKYGKSEKRMEGRAERGAVAEESMGDVFAKLPGENLVLHDVPSKFGNIDHVIISRTKGIILVETKSHHGKITAEGTNLLIDGRPTEKDFIRQTLNNCYWLKGWIKDKLSLEAWVNCVIVFTNGFVTIRGKIKGVWVINAKYFYACFDRISESRAAALLWEKREKLQGMAIASPDGSHV